MKKIFIIIGILLVFGLMVLFLPNLYIKNWKTFHSEKNGYSIEYPPYWLVEGISDDIIGLSSYHGSQGYFPPKGHVWFELWVQQLKTKSFDELVQEVADANKTEKKPIKIENADKAYVVKSYLYVLKGNKFFSIISTRNNPNFRNNLDERLILGSFKLD